MTNKIDGEKCRLNDPLKNLNQPETKIFCPQCPRFSYEIKIRKYSKDMNILVSKFSRKKTKKKTINNIRDEGKLTYHGLTM